MGNLLKVVSLGLFAAIGIASAISVATQMQPSSSEQVAGQGFSDVRGNLVGAAANDIKPVLLSEDPRATHRSINSPASAARLQTFPLGEDRGAAWIQPSQPATEDREKPIFSPLRPARPVAAPALMPLKSDDDTVCPQEASSDDSRENGAQPASPAAESNKSNQLREAGGDQGSGTVHDPSAAFMATYQPMVTAQFELMRDAINRIAQSQDKIALSQERTAQLVNTIQANGTQAAERATEDLPAPVPNEAAAPPKGVSTLKKDEEKKLLTLICQDSDIKDVLSTISEETGMNILASENVKGLISATLTDVSETTLLSAVLKSAGLVSRTEGDLIYVGTHDELHFVEHGGDKISSRIYRPNYITAQDLQTLITPMLSKLNGQITVSAASEVGIAPDSASAGGNSFSGDEVVVVRDFDGVLAEIDKVFKEVDCMPRQVAIEAMILSVTLDDKNELGVDFELLRQKDTLRITSGTPLVDLATGSFSDGLKIGFLDSSVFMFLNALETIGDTNVVASPRVMCLNKQRAEILIGSELGYVSTTITETAATQSVEFLEVGTQLSIRPFISSEGMIRMEVHPELSTGSVRVESGFTLPDKEVTQVTTNVMCPDGATVVIGGLIREDLVTSSTQIPVLGNLPWVGPAFRQRREEMDRREIIVLLTPRIIHEADLWTEGKSNSDEFKNRRDTFLDKMNPLGRRHFAERYLRKARAAWNAGDADTALRYCNLAIHFDPLHRESVALRREVLAVAPDLETSVHEHLRHGLAPGHLPHRDYSKHGSPWKLPDSLPGEPGTLHDRISEIPIENVAEPIHTIEIGPPPRGESR